MTKIEVTDELVENLAKAAWDSSEGYVTGIPWPLLNSQLRADKERRRVKAILAVLNGEFPYVGQRVEWNPTGEKWEPCLVNALNGNLVRVVLEDNEYINVDKRHLRPVGGA